MLTHYKNQSCEELRALIENDKITYSVLYNILAGKCSDIFTDHENVIVCYSAPPFPVWIWCGDTENTESINLIAQCIREYLPFEKGHYHIMSEDVFSALSGGEYFDNAYIDIDMLSYRLDELIPLEKRADGTFEAAKMDDLELLARYFHDFELEAEGIAHDFSYCRQHIKEYIESGQLFIWRADSGITAIAALVRIDDFGRVGAVYTVPGHRRKGYAYNLVRSLCKAAAERSLIPILYADGSYGASNNCYKKIGFRLVDRLCHIRKNCK